MNVHFLVNRYFASKNPAVKHTACEVGRLVIKTTVLWFSDSSIFRKMNGVHGPVAIK